MIKNIFSESIYKLDNNYLILFKVTPLGCNKLMPAFFPIFVKLLKCFYFDFSFILRLEYNHYLVLFKVTPFKYNKLMPASFPIFEKLLKHDFWYRQQLLFRFFFYFNSNKTGWLGFGFNVISQNHAPMIHHHRSWVMSMRGFFFAQNLAILKQSSLPHVSCLKHP